MSGKNWDDYPGQGPLPDTDPGEDWDPSDVYPWQGPPKEEPLPYTESNEKCPYCKIYQIMAESRLFKVPEALEYEFEGWPESTEKPFLWRSKKSFYRIEEGSEKGCQFCGLLEDAIYGRGEWLFVVDSELKFGWGLQLRDGQFLIEVWLYGYGYMSIFRGTGFDSQWNLQEQTQISGDTSSPAAVTTARRWLEDCKYNHVLCRRETNVHKFPQRILEYDGEKLRLCDSPEPTATYACLSHCWGPRGPAMQLRPDTMVDLKAGITLDNLPKTFRDAVWFCWRLGINNIWIDALCIIQGDEADWEEAAATMGDVYEGATITIAAAWSNSSETGCFAPARTSGPIEPLSESGLYSMEYLKEFPRDSGDYADDSLSWPLFGRAWVYQERKLSTRILHFGQQQLFWECKSSLLSESDLEGCELGLEDLKAEEEPEAGWRNVVSHYSPLTLTYEKDRLPAISACVKRMQRLRPGDVYIAGMWKNSLPLDLCWFTCCDKLKLARPDRPGLVMPSWSWISTSQGVFYDTESVPLLSLDDINVVYNITGPAHIGQVSHARIHLKARFMFIKPELTADSPFGTLGHPDATCGNNRPPLSNSSEWDFDYTTADPPIHTNETFVTLLLSMTWSKCFGIVLRELANKRFERVGNVHFLKKPRPVSGWKVPVPEPELKPAWLLGLPIGEFTIV